MERAKGFLAARALLYVLDMERDGRGGP
eukprot:COSAG05_NODE_17049_length_333_cov_0.658120_1_plen_27_part_10